MSDIWDSATAVSSQHRSFARTDLEAISWLKQHPTIRAVDSDKNLGLVVTSSDWIARQLDIHLQAYERITSEEMTEILRKAAAVLKAIVDWALELGVIDQGNARYLLQRLHNSRTPILRISVKVHKCPVESRPISNLRGFLLGPAGTMLNKLLLPIQKKFKTVATSTRDLIDEYEGGLPLPGEQFLTFDITSLYPSLTLLDDANSVIPVVAEAIDRHYAATTSWAEGELAIKLLHLVLRDQVITPAGRTGEFYKQTVGVTTGLGPAPTIANIYLAARFDRFVSDWLSLTRYCRYIDDSIAIISSRFSTEDVHVVLNSWHPIRVKPGDIALGNRVHILDIDLQLDDRRHIFVSTHIKPLSIGDYIPSTSAHHPHCSTGMMKGELKRLMLTNTRRLHYHEHAFKFMCRLRNRGLSTRKLGDIFHSLDFANRLRKRCRAVKDTTACEVGITVKYCKGLEHIRWSELTAVFFAAGGNCRPRYSVHQNLFRRLYKSTWVGG
eukprot:TRINITY_DN46278_c0_g1_i1.p1 TRINITY_DN46278_c0_g1~~TRINITY_DN46278_c0_g1_i1.p1  ORF type:complete len:543 (+),score=39.43 TRINITY_DN46278_c0_g1_i1:144-1631(+)